MANNPAEEVSVSSLSFSQRGEPLQNSDLRVENNEKIKRIAAIDIGTNSIHLVIALIDPMLNTFSIELAEKSSTRLGNRDQENGNLTDSSKNKTIEVLKRFKEIATSNLVDEIVLAATSAVREAPNGQQFLTQLNENLDLTVELVSGAEEARLIYLGVLSGMKFGDQPHVILDIGGGSTEVILADSQDARALTSTRLGAVSLQRDFIKDEPIPLKRLEFLRTFIQGSLEPAINKIASRVMSDKERVLVATSGTAMAIGTLVAAEEQDVLMKMHGYKFSKEKLDKLVEKLIRMTPVQRKDLPAISDRRSEIIVTGALIMQTAMEMLDINEVVLSGRALREGLVVDWMFRNGLVKDKFSFQGSIRERTVIHQTERFAVNRKRAERVARYALLIFDHTYGLLHQDKGTGRELLWAAAMLHACGQHINLGSYHKHSWYLIRHGELLGYSQIEHLMIACIARYHRKSLPKKKHDCWHLLGTKENRKIVSQMSLLLRLSVALDRRPDSVIKEINILSDASSKVSFGLVPTEPSQSLALEQWSLSNCRTIVKELTGVDLKVFIDT